MPVTPDDIRGRWETDLEDPALDKLIADAEAEVRRRYGPDRSTADPPVPVTVTVDGYRSRLDFPRPIESLDDVVELAGPGFVSGGSETTLAANDYQLENGGQTLRRLGTGDNPAGYSASDRAPAWGYQVRVSYFPVDDQAQRDAVVIKLVILELEFDPATRRSDGDHDQSNRDPVKVREDILGELAPRPGLLLA